MIRSALRCRKQKVRKKLIGRGPCPCMCFFTERFRQIERSSYPVVVGLFDETKRQILLGLRSWNLQSRGRSMLPIDSELCNKVKKIVKNMNAQKYIEKSWEIEYKKIISYETLANVHSNGLAGMALSQPSALPIWESSNVAQPQNLSDRYRPDEMVCMAPSKCSNLFWFQ